MDITSKVFEPKLLLHQLGTAVTNTLALVVAEGLEVGADLEEAAADCRQALQLMNSRKRRQHAMQQLDCSR